MTDPVDERSNFQRLLARLEEANIYFSLEYRQGKIFVIIAPRFIERWEVLVGPDDSLSVETFVSEGLDFDSRINELLEMIRNDNNSGSNTPNVPT